MVGCFTMELRFKTVKLKKQCEEPTEAQKQFGLRIGNKLTQRVSELQSAVTLDDIARIPAARLHRLKGSRKNEYAMDLVNQYRLVIVPILEGDADINVLASIKIVRIEEVTDYHGKQKRK
jgi:proteic killer suppression protein